MFSEKKKEGFLSLLVFAAVLGATFGIYGFYDKVWVHATLTADPLYVLRDTIWIALILLPVIAALRWSKQTLGSIGANRKDLKKNLALGLLTSSVSLLLMGILSPFLGGGFAGFSVPMIYFLVSYTVIGFGEEAVFRGYIQTRLTANRGPKIGIAVTTLFSLCTIFHWDISVFLGIFGWVCSLPSGGLQQACSTVTRFTKAKIFFHPPSFTHYLSGVGYCSDFICNYPTMAVLDIRKGLLGCEYARIATVCKSLLTVSTC